jgi:hypothetical protein
MDANGNAPATQTTEGGGTGEATDLIDLTERTGTHWHDWEFGCLIDQYDPGDPRRSIEQIAAKLGRSSAAVERMLQRLLTSEIDCPAGYQDKLQALRQLVAKAFSTNAAKNEPAQKQERRGGSFYAVLEDLRSQVNTTMQTVESVKAMATEIERLLIYNLALELFGGKTTSQELLVYLPAWLAERATRMTEGLRQHRRMMMELFARPMLTKEQTDTPQPPPPPPNIDRIKA